MISLISCPHQLSGGTFLCPAASLITERIPELAEVTNIRIFILFLAAAITVFVLACSAESNDLQDSASVADGEQALEFKSEADSFFTTAGATMATPAPALLAIGAPGPPGAAGGFGDDGRSSGSAMQTAQRKIISSASVSIQVEVV